MANSEYNPSTDYLHMALPERMTEGIIVRRIYYHGIAGIATNVQALRHLSQTGFDFGNDSPGSTDLALACCHAILARMDYVGPVQRIWDGSRVFELALELHQSFRVNFVESANGDELRIPWSRALSWMRTALLDRMRTQKLTQATLLANLQRTMDELPSPPPKSELDQAFLNRQLRESCISMAGEASVLSQYLGMIG